MNFWSTRTPILPPFSRTLARVKAAPGVGRQEFAHGRRARREDVFGDVGIVRWPEERRHLHAVASAGDRQQLEIAEMRREDDVRLVFRGDARGNVLRRRSRCGLPLCRLGS